MSDIPAAGHDSSAARSVRLRGVAGDVQGPRARSGQNRTAIAAPARPLSRPTLHQSVVDIMRDQIVTGAFAVGDRLADAALAESLGVSRTPIREALKVLAAEGLVTLIPRRGARVAGMTARHLAELFEVIGGLEQQAVELATARMSRRDRARLQALHDRMAQHFAARDREAYFQANHAIHLLLVALSGNSVLRETHAGLMAKVRRERFRALRVGERWQEAMDEHARLMDAIGRGEAALAGAIMARHVRHTADVVCTAFATDAAV